MVMEMATVHIVRRELQNMTNKQTNKSKPACHKPQNSKITWENQSCSPGAANISSKLVASQMEQAWPLSFGLPQEILHQRIAASEKVQSLQLEGSHRVHCRAIGLYLGMMSFRYVHRVHVVLSAQTEEWDFLVV